jgi:hypothetical protein
LGGCKRGKREQKKRKKLQKETFERRCTRNRGTVNCQEKEVSTIKGR